MHNIINNCIFFVFTLLNSEKGVAGSLISQVLAIIMNAVHVNVPLAFCSNWMLLFLHVLRHLNKCVKYRLRFWLLSFHFQERETDVCCSVHFHVNPLPPSLPFIFGAGCL